MPVNQDSISYGPQSIKFFGGWLLPNTGVASGLVLGVNTSTWAYAGDTAPVPFPSVRVAGTGVYNHFWGMSAAVGCGNVRLNFKLTGCS